MVTPELVKYFDLHESELIADASPIGLGAILTQVSVNEGVNILCKSLTQ